KHFAAAVCAALLLYQPTAAWSQNIDMTPMVSEQKERNLRLLEQENTTEKSNSAANFQFPILEPVATEDVYVPGFSRKHLDLLAFNHFIVVDNTKFLDMA